MITTAQGWMAQALIYEGWGLRGATLGALTLCGIVARREWNGVLATAAREALARVRAGGLI